MKNTRSIVLLASVAFILACSACRKPEGDEKQILTLISTLISAAEKHDLAALMEPVTEDFKVDPRSLDRSDLKKYLFIAFRKLGSFTIHYPDPTLNIEPNGLQASAKLIFLLLRKGESGTELQALRSDPVAWLENVGKRTRLYRAELRLIKSGGDWLVHNARFDRPTP